MQRRPHHQEVGRAQRAVPAGVPRTHIHCEQVSVAGDRDVVRGAPPWGNLASLGRLPVDPVGTLSLLSTEQREAQSRGVPGPSANCPRGGWEVGAGRDQPHAGWCLDAHLGGPGSSNAPWFQLGTGKSPGGHSSYCWEQSPQEMA